ncbi:MAG: 3-dehydroquinate synthase II [Candidatus Lokiarchaeota archaeon]|nr:3-dehydroquinate synthase II [Candidatus Lokiarchaeota archaeon]
MKKIILNFEKKSENFNELVQSAFNYNILDIIISEETFEVFKNIKRLKTYSNNAKLVPDNLILKEDSKLEELINQDKNIGVFLELKTKDDELKVVDLAKKGLNFIIVQAKDWKIIPFENLIAKLHSIDTELIAQVDTIKEAEVMFKTLEIGVDGVVFTPKNSDEILSLKRLIQTYTQIEITKAKILNIKEIPDGSRVCVDTTTLLHSGEGMLVGSTAKGFVLVHAEVFETQFVSSRPFRVNAGDVSAYILVPNDDPEASNPYKTNYLSELKAGDKVFVSDLNGNTRIVSVGRVKIEVRPMLLFNLAAEVKDEKIPINVILQNAETIRLISVDGKAVPVVYLKKGDEVLVHIGPGATHFGTKIKETIIEK